VLFDSLHYSLAANNPDAAYWKRATTTERKVASDLATWLTCIHRVSRSAGIGGDWREGKNANFQNKEYVRIIITVRDKLEPVVLHKLNKSHRHDKK